MPNSSPQESPAADEESGIPAATDDFDDFAEEQDMAEDDFGDFDDGFQEPSADILEDEPSQIGVSQPPTPPMVVSVPFT